MGALMTLCRVTSIEHDPIIVDHLIGKFFCVDIRDTLVQVSY